MPKMIMNFWIVGKLRGALLDQAERPLVVLLLIQDPTKGVSDIGIVRIGIVSFHRKPGSPVQIASVLRIDISQIIGRPEQNRDLPR